MKKKGKFQLSKSQTHSGRTTARQMRQPHAFCRIAPVKWTLDFDPQSPHKNHTYHIVSFGTTFIGLLFIHFCPDYIYTQIESWPWLVHGPWNFFMFILKLKQIFHDKELEGRWQFWNPTLAEIPFMPAMPAPVRPSSSQVAFLSPLNARTTRSWRVMGRQLLGTDNILQKSDDNHRLLGG